MDGAAAFGGVNQWLFVVGAHPASPLLERVWVERRCRP
jgi:hypothetical protein